MEWTLGEVDVEITSAPIMFPAQPIDPVLTWTTRQIQIGTLVRMVNGALWRVLARSEDAQNSRIGLELGQPSRPARLALTVAVVDQDVPIWLSNVPAPEPELNPEPPVIVPDAPPPPDNPATPGDPVQEPGEAPEPAAP